MTQQKISKRYSEAYKQKVIAEIRSGRYTKFQAAKVYDVDPATIHLWLKKSGNHHLLNKVIHIQMANERDKIKQLEKEKKALESALAQTQLKLLNAEATIEIYEEEYGIAVKKNAITGSLHGPSKKDNAQKGSR
ncbi:transposase [bacterium]|nr:transposase [bacterium]MCI0617899.1 transposase [bacterium]